MTPFMKFYWEQQKCLFTPSSSWARYHPLIICFCLSLAAFCLGASTQYKHLTTSKWKHPKRLKKNSYKHSKVFQRKVIKTTSGYNGTDRFVALLFDGMKIKTQGDG